MSHFLVTGGAGFIGRALCARLAAAGHDLTVLDDFSSGIRAGLPPGVRVIEADICDAAAIAAALYGTHGVFHLAAISSVEACTERRAETNRTNLHGTVTLLEQLGPRPVVYTSSAAIYGEQAALPIGEGATPDPISPYAVDKLASERHCQIAAHLRGGRAMVVRPFNVFGPGQSPSSPYAGVITRFVTLAVAGLPITVNGDGGQVRDFIHVADVARALDAAMGLAMTDDPGTVRRYNLCSGRPVSVVDLAERIEARAGSHAARHHGPSRAGDIRQSIGDPSRARDELGFAAEISLDAGLDELIEAARATWRATGGAAGA
ncbi:MAG: NAD-dependent epimerase/dehydratase family protein [Pseudomonadota bacterium]